jgi:hypothetical protein
MEFNSSPYGQDFEMFFEELGDSIKILSNSNNKKINNEKN